MSDVEYRRIKDPGTGDEFTYDTAKIEALGLHDAVIDKDPFGPDGLPAPVKQQVRDRKSKTSGAKVSGDSAGQ